MNKIEHLLPSHIFYPLMCSSEGELKKTFILNFFLERVKGYFGYSKQADLAMIRLQGLKLLEEVEGQVTKDQADKISEFMVSTQLIPSKKRMSHEIERVKAIASHLKLSPSLETFSSLIDSYRASKHLPPLKKVTPLELTAKEKESSPSNPTWNWALIGAVCLIAVGALAWTFYRHNTPPQIEMNPFSKIPVDFSETLSPICHESVLSYSTRDGTKYLKDFLDPKWEAVAFYSERDPYPLCRVELVAGNCEELVVQRFAPEANVFLSNFERIPAVLTEEQKKNPIVEWALHKLPALSGSTVSQLWFKSHISCRNLG